jgi:hypothetical protein
LQSKYKPEKKTTAKLPVLQLNDSQTYLESHQEMFGESGDKVYRQAGGFARITGYLLKCGMNSKEQCWH